MNEYGIYVALIAKAALFSVFAEFGFAMYLSKEVSVNRDDIAEVSSLVWIFLIVKLVAFVIAFAILLLCSGKFGLVEYLLAAFVFFQFMNITPILTGLENYKFLTKLQLLTRALMVLLVLIVNFASLGLEKALAIQVGIAALTSFSLFIYFIKNYKLERVMFSFAKLKAVLMGSLPFYGAKLFVNLYQQSSTYFVSFALSSEQVAIYSIAIQLYKVGQSVIGAVARVLYTSTVKTKDFALIKKLTIRSFFVHLSVFPIVFFYGDQILNLIFSFDVKELIDLSIVLYLSLLLTVVSSYWGYPALAAIGKENYAHLGIFISSVAYFAAFSILVAFNLSSVYLMVGCIIFSEFVGMLVRLFFARKFKLL
jgi:O-antigen/teichoic acid export membrane protein